MRRYCILFVLISVLIFQCQSVEARLIRVPAQFNSIQNAIDNSDDGDTVLVDRGRYSERINFNGKSIFVTSNYTFTEDEEDIIETIIDGGIEEGSRVVIRSGEDAVLTGFTITGGRTDYGGGIYCRSSTAIFSHLIVEGNTVERNGAGIYCTRNSNVLIHDVIIRENSAGYVGGAFSCFGGSDVTMRNVLIYNNECDHVGGALHCYGAELTLENVTIFRNYAPHSGGALYLTAAGSAQINNSILWNNAPHEIYLMTGNDSTHLEVYFSDVDGGLDEIVDVDGSQVDWGTGNIDLNPLFVNAELNNFQLGGDSPCVDAGHYEEDPDPDGSRRDMGRYYLHQEDGGSVVHHVPTDFESIQEAIDEAETGDVVLVQPGEYFENIRLASNITLGSRLISTGDNDFIESTIIDADGEGSVIIVEGDIPDALVSGFTVQNGENADGGGVVCRETNATLSNLLVQENSATQRGGGIYIGNEENIGPTLIDIIVTNNNSRRDGGGIYIVQAENNDEIILENVIITENQAQTGGGMFIVRSISLLSNVQISNNSASVAGGLFIQSSAPIFSQVIISGNSSIDEGSAFILSDSDPHLNNVTIAANSSENFGEVILIGAGSYLNVTNSIIWGNNSTEIHFMQGDNSISVHHSDIENGEDALVENDEDEFEVEWGDGNINADPQFTDPDEGDFSLAENSPCIDAGDRESPRDPDGTVADMGALYTHQNFDYSRLFMVPDDYQTIQEAIEVTQYGDSILVRPGVYEENIDMRGHTIFVGSLFAITHDPAYIDSTIINGGGNDVAVKFARGENGTLSGFRIENGSGNEGGGIFIYNSNPTIEYCLITDNSAQDGGGGVFCYGGSVKLYNCTIGSNQSNAGAGGIFIENAVWLYVYNSIIWGNEPEEIMFSAERDANNIDIGYSVVAGGENGIITNFNGQVNWEDGNIEDNPQFVDQESGNFYLTENSPCIDAGEYDLPIDPDGTPADIGAFYFDHGGEVVDFRIRLVAGWNVISSPVQPPILSMDAVFSEIVENENLLIVKNQRGRFFRPDQEFNNIDGWDVRYGYWVKLIEEDVLIISNRFVQQDIPIPLGDGWSIVSYFPAQRVDVMLATAGIVEELLVMKDFQGRFYMPRYDFSNMAPLMRGAGYQLKIDDDIDLIWQVPDEERIGLFAGNSINNYREASHFNPVISTPYNMSVLITEASAYIQDAEIGAFSKNGLCVGSVKLNENGMTGLAVWGDDPTTEIIEGLVEGEQLYFKLWFKDESIDAEIEWEYGEGNYYTDSYSVGELSFYVPAPHEFTLHDPYPNPFNSTVRLSFSLPEANLISFSIYDISGRLVVQLEQHYQTAGIFRIVLNSDRWSSGIYFAELKAGRNVRMKKMVLVK